MKPTKKELRIKLKLMEIALRYYIQQFDKERYGICEVICICSHRIDRDDCEYLHKKHSSTSFVKTYIPTQYVSVLFPELLKYKPDSYVLYWWNRNNKAIRIKVIKELIESYKEQLK